MTNKGYLRTNYRRLTGEPAINAFGSPMMNLKAVYGGGNGCLDDLGGGLVMGSIILNETNMTNGLQIGGNSAMEGYFGSGPSWAGYRIMPFFVDAKFISTPSGPAGRYHWWASISDADSTITFFCAGTDISFITSTLSAVIWWAGLIISAPGM